MTVALQQRNRVFCAVCAEMFKQGKLGHAVTCRPPEVHFTLNEWNIPFVNHVKSQCNLQQEDDMEIACRNDQSQGLQNMY
jgi:hypothetical protein